LGKALETQSRQQGGSPFSIEQKDGRKSEQDRRKENVHPELIRPQQQPLIPSKAHRPCFLVLIQLNTGLSRRPKTVQARDGGCGLWRARNRKWTHPANRPLAFEPSPKEAQTHKPIGGPVPKGLHHNPLTFRRRLGASKKWLRL